MATNFDAELDAPTIVGSIFEAYECTDIKVVIGNAISQLVVYALALCQQCAHIEALLDDITRDGRNVVDKSEGGLVHEVQLNIGGR